MNIKIYQTLKEQFDGLRDSLRTYFRAYGGWRYVLSSPIFLFSIILSLINYNSAFDAVWVSQAQSILPNILGFSLGTYSVIFSILSDRIRLAMNSVEGPTGHTYMEELGSTFFHFIFVQAICILYSILYNSNLYAEIFYFMIDHDLFIYYYVIRFIMVAKVLFSFAGLILLNYSILLTIAASMVVYRIASINERGSNEGPTNKTLQS